MEEDKIDKNTFDNTNKQCAKISQTSNYLRRQTDADRSEADRSMMIAAIVETAKRRQMFEQLTILLQQLLRASLFPNTHTHHINVNKPSSNHCQSSVRSTNDVSPVPRREHSSR